MTAISWASSPGARSRMQKQASRDTAPERQLRSALHRMGYRFRLHRQVLGMPRRSIDVAFPAPRVAVFVDGCFWHGCPEHGREPAVNPDYWNPKIIRNRERDLETSAHLESLGWTVVRIWEHEDVAEAASRVSDALEHRSSASRG